MLQLELLCNVILEKPLDIHQIYYIMKQNHLTQSYILIFKQKHKDASRIFNRNYRSKSKRRGANNKTNLGIWTMLS